MRNLLFISTWFRGKAITLPDLLNMDIGYVTTLNRIAYEQSRSKEEMEKRKAQELNDAMVDEGVM